MFRRLKSWSTLPAAGLPPALNTPEWKQYLARFERLGPEYFQDIPAETTKFCVIIEPRPHPFLLAVIKNFVFMLKSHGWGLIVFHGIQNQNLLQELRQWKGGVRLVNMKIGNMSVTQYNMLLTSSTFWRELHRYGCETALIFQTDTLLLNSEKINDFVRFDYVGAPWCVKWLSSLEIGNGGLSMRRIAAMLAICQKYPVFKMNEDIYFSYCLQQEGAEAIMPTVEEAKTFSVETVYNAVTCGMHQPHLDKFPSYKAFVELLQQSEGWNLFDSDGGLVLRSK